YDAGGTYTVTLTVTGPGGGNTPTTSKTITVNAPPLVSITAPPDGTTSAPDLPVTFTGSATDSEDGNLAAGIKWSSNIDGALGSVASITSSLTSGAHTITASVTDSGGKTSTQSVSITVNGAPSLAVTAPTNDALYQLGDSVPLTGTASDPEDGDLSA